MFIIITIISVLIGWWVGTIEMPAGFSGVIAIGAARKRYMVTGIILLFFIGACVHGGILGDIFIIRSSLTNPFSAVIVAFAASIAVLTTYRLSKYSSICYGLLGAMIAWSAFTDYHLDALRIIRLILSWCVAPVLSGLLSAGLYRLYRSFIRRKDIHLLLLFRYLRIAVLVVVAGFILSIGINNGTLFVTLFETVSSEFDFSCQGTKINEEYILMFISLLFITLLTWKRASVKIGTMAGSEFDVSIEPVLITLFSATVILLFFSTPVVCNAIGLVSTPLSIAGIVLGGFSGINFLRKREKSSYREEYKMLLATLITPLIAFLITYFVLNAINVDIISTDHENGIFTPHRIINLTPVIAATLILSCCAFMIIYLRTQRRIRIQAELTLLKSQNTLFENQKNLSALEIKAVIAENEQLNARLEMKKKELINIALGITEQKKIQEDLYKEIKGLKKKNDLNELKQGIEEIEKQLLQKMNFSRELGDFYAQIELLHKDFNMRLTEKHPNLSEQERRLTTLLRLGFSSKHIASLMNISPKSVEISRYRLRNKLGLEHGQKLIRFIKEI